MCIIGDGMNGRFVDKLIAVWVAAVGISFALLPLVGMAISADSCGLWVARVWDAWRYVYGVALIVCSAGGAVRACRWLNATRRHTEWQDQR